jgi:CheY-like chemotaxis protein
MANEPPRRKQFLFVDDDSGFLKGIRQVFMELSGGSWEIFTAENHAQALALLQQQPMEVVVLDLDMPVMDGLSFLRLLGRTHPGQQVVIWTGRATEESRRACLGSGAALYLEKLIAPEGFAAVFAALNALADAQPQDGFRGMMRRVDLPEVLQMECLGRKSSVLEVFAGKVRGRIYIADGAIVHAESGALQGEMALYGLLGLRGGEFNLLPFAEPPRRTISGHYEFLLMEAARLNDEGTTFYEANALQAAPVEMPPPEPASPGAALAPRSARPVRIAETLLCSGAGEVLYEQDCRSRGQRLNLLNQIEAQAARLTSLLAAGRFDRLEIITPEGRAVCQLQPHLRLFVRSANSPTPVA